MKQILYAVTALVTVFQFSLPIQAQSNTDSSEKAAMIYLNELITLDSSIKYLTGSVELNSELNLNIPAGYKFMNRENAEKIVFDYWGNPRSEGILGMLVKENYTLLDTNSWAFVVSYEEAGYIKDKDADKIDYDDMMKEIQESEKEENKEREKNGYASVHVLGWAVKPFYDKTNNVLHWAKSIQFGNNESKTLNYDVRLLGRRGLLSLNAVGDVSQLKDIQSHIPEIIHIAKFKKGSTYSDFNPSTDKVAAYTIGGLVAGKLLAKAGILALLLKNIKLILIGAAAIFGGFGKRIFSFFRKKPSEENSITTDQP